MRTTDNKSCEREVICWVQSSEDQLMIGQRTQVSSEWVWFWVDVVKRPQLALLTAPSPLWRDRDLEGTAPLAPSTSGTLVSCGSLTRLLSAQLELGPINVNTRQLHSMHATDSVDWNTMPSMCSKYRHHTDTGSHFVMLSKELNKIEFGAFQP